MSTIIKRNSQGHETRYETKQAKPDKRERQRASTPDQAPADPMVYATVTTGSGWYSAEMRMSVASALQAAGASVQTVLLADRSSLRSLPKYEPPPAVTRSQNYDRFTGWQKVQQTRVVFSHG